MCSISEDTFNSQIKEIHSISEQLKDSWELCLVQNCLHLKKRQIVLLDSKKQHNSSGELVCGEICEENTVESDSACLAQESRLEEVVCNFEYHIVYSASYQVPVLYFNVHKTDGSLLTLEELWGSVPSSYVERLQYEKWTFITQQEHPLLGRPFFQLHPCHTADLMGQVGSTSRNSTCSNKVILYLPDVGISGEWTVEEIEALRSKLKKVDVMNPAAPTEEHLTVLKQFAQIDEQTIETRHLALVSFLHMFTSILQNQISSAGVHVQVGSNLPPGAGLGSSAAYSTCLAASLLVLAGHVAAPDVLNGQQQSPWTDCGDLELINKWAFQSEKILHGKPSGIDNAVSTYGGTVIFQHGKITPMEKTPQLEIMLTNTKVPRSTKLLVAGVAERHKRFPAVIQPVLDSIEEITKECEQIFSSMNTAEQMSSAEHYSGLGELIEVNQHLLSALGVSHPSLTQVCEISQKYKLHSKLTGAGGGGCAFTLIPSGTKEGVLEAFEEDITKAGFECWKTQIGGNGVTFHRALLNKDVKLPKSFGDS